MFGFFFSILRWTFFLLFLILSFSTFAICNAVAFATAMFCYWCCSSISCYCYKQKSIKRLIIADTYTQSKHKSNCSGNAMRIYFLVYASSEYAIENDDEKKRLSFGIVLRKKRSQIDEKKNGKRKWKMKRKKNDYDWIELMEANIDRDGLLCLPHYSNLSHFFAQHLLTSKVYLPFEWTIYARNA